MNPFSLYLHIPFCQKRCHYCDFTTYAGLQNLMPNYVDTLRKEIRQLAISSEEKVEVHTIFFGGGTPSLLSLEQFESLLREIHNGFNILSGAEISLEANPGTVTRSSLEEIKSIGFNRISFGVQSFHSRELVMMGRIHNREESAQAVEWAYQAGFSNLNLDLIFGLPGQSFDDWEKSLQRATELGPTHLSLYALTVEEGTNFYHWVNRGMVERIDDDLAAEMYELASEKLENAGYRQYEISNWSKPGMECRHNLQYWKMKPYLGLGAGAHGYVPGLRTANTVWIPDYIQRMQEKAEISFPFSPANITRTSLSLEDEMGEFMMVGLRLVQDGISAGEFEQRFGKPFWKINGARLDKLQKRGLVEQKPEDHDSWRLTKGGKLLGNQVFMEFV